MYRPARADGVKEDSFYPRSARPRRHLGRRQTPTSHKRIAAGKRTAAGAGTRTCRGAAALRCALSTRIVTLEGSAQGVDVLFEARDLGVSQAGGLANALHYVRRAQTQLFPGFRQPDADLALVRGVAPSADITERFQAFQHRGERIRLQIEFSPELAYRLIILFP